MNILVENEDWFNIIRDPLIKISHVNRDFLKGADSLARQGKDMEEVISAWC